MTGKGFITKKAKKLYLKNEEAEQAKWEQNVQEKTIHGNEDLLVEVQRLRMENEYLKN